MTAFTKWLLRKYYFLVADSVDKNLVVQALGIILGTGIPCAITVGITRINSIYNPEFGLIIAEGLRIHHFNFGIFITEIIALYGLFHMDGRITRFCWSVAYGVGQGLIHDEQSYMFWLRDDEHHRWSLLGMAIGASRYV